MSCTFAQLSNILFFWFSHFVVVVVKVTPGMRMPRYYYYYSLYHHIKIVDVGNART